MGERIVHRTAILATIVDSYLMTVLGTSVMPETSR
jgi:hypothetical protein